MEEKDNKEIKFPVNAASVAGVITRVVTDENKNRANITVLSSIGDRNQFINVLVSGEKRYKNFMEHLDRAQKGLENEEKKNPLVKFSGEAFFGTNEYNGSVNQNYTLIVNGPLDQADIEKGKFLITASEAERIEFRNKFNSNNPQINKVQIRGNLTADPTYIPTKNNKEFTNVTIGHNYAYLDANKVSQSAVMFTSVIVPSAMIDKFKEQNFQKGDPVQITGKIQNVSFDTNSNKKVYSFNIVASSFELDIKIKNSREEKKKEKETLELTQQEDQKPKKGKRQKTVNAVVVV